MFVSWWSGWFHFFTILPGICELLQLVGVILLVLVLIFGKQYGLVADLVIPLVQSLWFLVSGVLMGCAELGNWVVDVISSGVLL